MSIRKNIIESAKHYLSNDKIGGSIFTLLVGKRPDQVNVNKIADVIEHSPQKKAKVFLQSLRKLTRENKADFSSRSSKLLDELEKCISSRKLLIIISGPSAVGKDQLAVNCMDTLESGNISARILSKFGTRVIQPGERPEERTRIDGRRLDPSAYYWNKTEKEMRKDKDLFYLYPRFEHLYGFPLSDLINPNKNSDVLFVIFGPVNLINELHKKLKGLTTRKITSILLKAPERDLRLRQKNRKYFTDSEKHIRNEEMMNDLRLINNPEINIDEMYDLIFKNGNSVNINSIESEVIAKITEKLHIMKC